MRHISSVRYESTHLVLVEQAAASSTLEQEDPWAKAPSSLFSNFESEPLFKLEPSEKEKFFFLVILCL